MARVIAPKLSEFLGQQVVAENRGGAGATIGAEIAAKSAPDGYTLMLATITNAIGASLYSKLNYDLVRDFAPITRLATTPHILVVHPSVPVKTVKEFVALAKAKPGELAYSSSGSGSAAHLAGELFNSLTGVKTTHVPYKGGGPSMIALVGGEVSVAFATMPSAIGYVRSGRLRGIAVTTERRSPSTPELHHRRDGRSGLRGRIVVRTVGAGRHAERDHRPAAHGDDQGCGASRCQGAPLQRRVRDRDVDSRAIRGFHAQ
jgi:tripartite-type tricarboxylate transporter receptor subunit TctC